MKLKENNILEKSAIWAQDQNNWSFTGQFEFFTGKQECKD